jgi:Flp pilus assembly protein TadB
MMSKEKKTATRRVDSHDPSLTPEANRLVTRELREIVGSATVEVPGDRHDSAGDRHATHKAFMADVINARLALLITALVLLITLGVAAISGGGVIVLIVVVLAMLAAVVALVVMTTRMAREVEHVAPETAAALQEQGVGDPDRLLTDLVAEFTRSNGVPGDRSPGG